MPTDISDNSLIWEADIDFTKIKLKAAEIDKLFAQIGKRISFDDEITKAASSAEVAIKPLNTALQNTVEITNQSTAAIEEETTAIKARNTEMGKYTGLTNQTAGKASAVPYKLGAAGNAPVVPENSVISPSTLALINEGKLLVGELDAVTQAYINELIGLQSELKQVELAQKELNTSYAQGLISEEEFALGTTALTASNLELKGSIEAVNATQVKYIAESDVIAGSIDSMNIRLAQLKAEWTAMGEAQRKSLSGQDNRAAVASLEKDIKGLTTTATNAGNAVVKGASSAFSFVRQLAYILPGIGIAGIFGVIIDGITSIISSFDFFDSAFTRTANTLREIRKTANEEIGKTVGEVQLLQKITQDHTQSIDQQQAATKRLSEINDENNKRTGEHNKLLIDSNGILSANDTAINKLTESLVRQAKTRAFLGQIEKAYGDILQAQTQDLGENTSKWEDFFNILKGGLSLSGGQVNDVIQGQIDARGKNIQKATDQYNNLNAAFQKALASGDVGLDGFFKHTAKLKATTEEYNNLLKKVQTAMEKISSLERDARQTGFTKKLSEVDNINQKYDEQIQKLKDLNVELLKYNTSHGGKDLPLISSADFDRVNAARNLELQNFQYQQDAKNYIDALQTKQDAFNKLHDAITSGDTDQASKVQEIYKSELQGFMSYVALLTDERNKLIAKVLSGQFNTGDILKIGSLTDQIKKQTPVDQNNQKAAALADYNSLIAATTDYHIKKKAIDDKYDKLERTLKINQSKFTADQYAKQLQDFNDARQKETEDLLLGQDEVYQKYINNKELFTARATDAVIAHLEKERAKVKEGTDEYNALTNAINATNIARDKQKSVDISKGFADAANIISTSFSNLSLNINDNLKITGQQLSQVASNISNLFDKNSSKSSQVGSIIGLVTFVVTSVRDALLTADDLATGLESSATDYDNITKAIEGQNFALEHQRDLINDLYGPDRVAATVALMDTIGQKEKDTLAALKKLNIEIIQSSRSQYIDPIFGASPSTSGVTGFLVNLLTGGTAKSKVKVQLESIDTSQFTTFEDFVNLLDDIKQNGGTFKGKLVTDDDLKSLEDLVSQYKDLQEQQRQLKDQLEQLFTGTTADNIADGIIQGLQAGKKSAADFADNFEDLMRQAILNSIKINTLEKPLAAFYDQFAQFSATDGILTPEEIATLKQNYNDIIGKANEQFDALQQITKIDLSGTASDNANNSLTGAIKGITEQQAELLAGQFGGLRLTALEQLQVARDQFLTLGRIDNNTFLTADRLQALLTKFDNYESGTKWIYNKLK